MTLFVTLHDDLETCLDVDAIKAIVGIPCDIGGAPTSVVIDVDNQQYRSPLRPSEVRARMEAAVQTATN